MLYFSIFKVLFIYLYNYQADICPSLAQIKKMQA